MVGYCPQVDVFFDDLTVQEHVVYYAGVSSVGFLRNDEDNSALTNKLKLFATEWLQNTEANK
ncbi:hypothetical protein HPB48_020649 [Haemaphysalis longicornis]|uniref:Uncharacterized protein n=1 Tax=Haemaphysalis longicornis TaxID=44386 RepID=A0A9J6FXX9_HAELO|nr:hypothetical protein HPB48_020649 [Haemaphysalis longicornis]